MRVGRDGAGGGLRRPAMEVHWFRERKVGRERERVRGRKWRMNE